MKYVIKKIPAFNVIGVSLTIPDPSLASYQIGQFWDEFRKSGVKKRIPNKLKPENTIAVYTNYVDAINSGYSLILGVAVEHTVNVPANMVAVTIPDQRYAVFSVEGDIPDSIAKTWDVIWKSPFKRAFTYDFELYKNESLNAANIDIYVALEQE